MKYCKIPYEYDWDDVLDRFENDDVEWFENDMMNLIGNSKITYKEVSEVGTTDGLYIVDEDMMLFTVVHDGEVIYDNSDI